jgi:hypothetical protein
MCVTTQKWIQDQNVVWFFWNRWEIESDWVTILIVLSKMCTCVNTNSLNEETAYIKICTVFCHWLCPLLPPRIVLMCFPTTRFVSYLFVFVVCSQLWYELLNCIKEIHEETFCMKWLSASRPTADTNSIFLNLIRWHDSIEQFEGNSGTQFEMFPRKNS